MDKRLSAEEMAVGGDLHWDLLVKQGHRERENQGIVCGVRDSSCFLFFFFLFMEFCFVRKGKSEGKLSGVE